MKIVCITNGNNIVIKTTIETATIVFYSLAGIVSSLSISFDNSSISSFVLISCISPAPAVIDAPHFPPHPAHKHAPQSHKTTKKKEKKKNTNLITS